MIFNVYLLYIKNGPCFKSLLNYVPATFILYRDIISRNFQANSLYGVLEQVLWLKGRAVIMLGS